MDRDEPLRYCLAKPGAWEDMPWEGDVVAKVGEKIFALFGSPDEGPGSVALKCAKDSEAAKEWRDRFPDAVTVTAYIGRYGWNTFRLDGTVPDGELLELMDASYAAVVARLPKAQRP